MIFKTPLLVASAAIACIAVSGCASNSSDTASSKATDKVTSATPAKKVIVPGRVIDLSHWNITIPTDHDKNGKPDSIKIPTISQFSHSDFFYVNEDNNVVFASPNKATTTANSSNTRSELRQMGRGSNKKIKTKAYGNNFAVEANPKSGLFAAVGGKMEATLSVNHVSVSAGYPDKAPAYSAVVGQIHGVKEKTPLSPKYGYGNEPLKIYYKKFPNHNTGSVFWTYERNLAKNNPDRRDIAYPVWGNTWDIKTDPGSKGIALNEEFSYTVNVHENIMYLTFESAKQGTVKYEINLSNNVDAYGNVDSKDNSGGYTGDQMYFKAGIYNQCSTKDQEGFWYAACPGTGKWGVDKANGHYAQSTFSKLVLSPSEAPK